MKNQISTYSILLLLAFTSVSFEVPAQDGPTKKKTTKTCSAGCEGLSGLRKRSLQQPNNASSAKTPASDHAVAKTK